MKMIEKRDTYLKYNSLASLFQQLVSLVYGLAIPQLIIKNYGSGINGTIAAITQFISITSLLQGGMTSAARVALYKPIATNNINEISGVYYTCKRFYRRFAVVLFSYIFVLACTYSLMFTSAMMWRDTFFLVLIIGMGSVVEYVFGITNQLLLFAEQRNYINTLLQTMCTILCIVLCAFMITRNIDIVIVKLICTAAMIIRPIVLAVVVNKKYTFNRTVDLKHKYIEQSGSALAKSIAYYVHSSTDALVLTVFANPLLVSVYAVHKYVVGSISSIVASILGNTEAMFGHLYTVDKQKLEVEFPVYDLMAKLISSIFFGTCLVMIVPFIRLYTREISDISYEYKAFAFTFCVAEYCYCTGLPYHNMVMASGHIKQTRWISVVEALLNIVLSCALVSKYGLIGVAIGTMVAFCFNSFANCVYVHKNVFTMSYLDVFRNYLSNIIPMIVAGVIFSNINFQINNYWMFFVYSILVFVTLGLLCVGVNFIVNRNNCIKCLKKMIHRINK